MNIEDTKMNIKIEKMTLDDFEQIQSCLIEEFDDFWSPTMLKQELENKQNLNSHYFVAKLIQSDLNEIVGFAGITIVIDEVNIMNIVVKKDKRNLGIGSLLLEAIIQFAKQSNTLMSCNISSITLEVNEKNLPAISLYQKYDFQQVGIRKKYYNNSDDALIMNLII